MVNQPHLHKEKKLLRINDVQALTGLKRSSIYSKIAIGEFPKPIKLSERSVAWVSDEVNAWIEARIEQSRMRRQGGVV